MVGNTEKITKTSAAKYFPKMICVSEIGLVVINSMVPLFFSSANERIVIAGIKNINIQGAKLKKESSVAYPSSRILVSGKTQANKPLATKKIVMAM